MASGSDQPIMIKKVKKVAAAKRHAAKTAVKKAKKEAPATTETASDGKAEK